MRNNLETRVRKNFLRAALVLPILMGFIPERRRLALQEVRIKMLKNQTTSLYQNDKKRKAVFIMEKAQREEYQLNNLRRSKRIANWLSRKQYVQLEMRFKEPKAIIKKGNNLSFLDISFMKSYAKAEMEIAKRLGLTDLERSCVILLQKLEKAKPGENLD